MRGGDTKTVLRSRGFSNAAVEAAEAAEAKAKKNPTILELSAFNRAKLISNAA